MTSEKNKTQRIEIEDDMPARCIRHVRIMDDHERRLTDLEDTCEQLKHLPAQVATIANTLKIQTAILGIIGIAAINKFFEIWP
jgi:hypothetical protein